MEWREGITRCPEHDVDLVEDPPEGYEDEYSDEEVTLVSRLGLEGAAGYTAIVVVVAAFVYGLSGVVAAGWVALATAREWYEPGPFELVRFVNDAARAVAVGGLGCLAAGVLARASVRLGAPLASAVPVSEDEDEDDDEDQEEWIPGPAGWVVTLLSSLAIVFALVWAVTGVAISWDSLEVQQQAFSPFGPQEDPSDTFLTLSAVKDAAWYCAMAALVSLGSLLMARGWDRIARRR